MRRREQTRRAGIILLVVGAGIGGIMLGVVLFITNPGLIPVPIPTPATATPAPFIDLPTSTPVPTWIVTFDYRFPAEPWTPGRHAYQLGVSCPAGIGTGTYQGNFTVSASAPLLSGRVYLRPTGVWDAATGGNPIIQVNTEQTVGAALSLRYDTLDQAETARQNCKASVVLDRSRAVRMDPSLPQED
jgi:hypothetical protein